MGGPCWSVLRKAAQALGRAPCDGGGLLGRAVAVGRHPLLEVVGMPPGPCTAVCHPAFCMHAAACLTSWRFEFNLHGADQQ